MPPLNNPLAQQMSELLVVLTQAAQQERTLTYRQLITELALPVPAMQRLTYLLEQLTQRDWLQQQPLRSALVVSQRPPYLPKQGWFSFLQQLDAELTFVDSVEQAAWHQTQLQQVYAAFSKA